MNLYSILQKFLEEFNLRRLFILSARSLEINFYVYKQANSVGVPCEFHHQSSLVLPFFCVRFALHYKAELRQVKDIMKTYVKQRSRDTNNILVCF
jgi:late competence protein required for DNA uptake (superfamily II DNA/RNA helicase)